MELVKYTAPSSWASYYINGDASDMHAADVHAADEFLAWVGCGPPIDCEDAGFSWHHDAHRFLPLGADCKTYTFLKVKP
jgi:hypothetical protein